MSNKKFERFGKYLILDHLVDGGMAKICRARYLGEQANKMVAVKMVQPQFSNDEAFVRMFQDELNITFGMLHPNIMQVYDYGKVSGQLYTAMEYIHGANLKQYLDRLKERKVVFPVEISCYIISQVCLGLHYAHTFTDKLTGKPFNIIHRDISPHNIMVTYDGAVKVIDFGIAKANTNSEATQAGTIKGKLSYLAPEYLDGMELDARYDEFAVGITLWEMLCSRKLFQANNDLAVLKLIQSCKITPPSQINPLVPKELDEIVMKALSKDRSHRYENLDQMNRALVRFLYSTYPDFNATDVKIFAYDLFKSELSKDEENFVEYGKIDILPYIEDLKREESRTGKIKKGDSTISGRHSHETHREKLREIELAIEPAQVQIGIELPNPERSTTRKLNKSVIKSNIKGATTVSQNTKTFQRGKTSTKIVFKKDLSKSETDEQTSSSGFLFLLLTASLAAVSYFQADFVEELTGFNLYKIVHSEENSGRSVSSVNSAKKSRPSTIVQSDTKGQVVMGGVDLSMEIYVDGVKKEFIHRPLEVDLNKEVTITVKKSGHVPFSTKVTLTKEMNSTVINVPSLERNRSGLLTTSQNYAAGSKLVYEFGGKMIEKDLPFQDVEIPEGYYQAKVINPVLGTEKKVEFTIEENKKHFLE